MKLKIKSYNDDLKGYLTLGKLYEGWYTSNMWSVGFYADDGSICVIFNINCCSHLNGGEWEIIE